MMAKLRGLTMPKWGIEMTEGTIAEWMVAEGATFAKGDVLTLIETDKITNDVEAEFEGTVARIVVPAGQTVPVGELLAVVASEPFQAADVDRFVADFVAADTRTAAAGGAAPASRSRQAPAGDAQRPALPADLPISPAARRHAQDKGVGVEGIAGSGRNGRITLQDMMLAERPASFTPAPHAVSVVALGQVETKIYASPSAKRLAVQHGIDLAGIKGTGPRGRISKADVLGAAARRAPPAAPSSAQEPSPSPARVAPAVASVALDLDGPFEAIAMSSMRKAVARQLTLSKQTVPHFYLRVSVQLDAVAHLRQLAKQATGAAPSVNDYITRATALALMEHPGINVQVHGDEIRQFARANIAIAVETPKGLVTPVVRGAEKKSVAEISAEIKRLAESARAGRLQADDMRGGSFSISNLGMFGVESFDAIVNPPQGAILAVGAAVRRPVDVNHAIGFATLASLSLSFDHRAIDGAAGARFAQTLKALLEEPARLML
jgi:pyruvate dehydrogenase E2 component (dihydrolipoamide acetyltransferase)